MTRNNANKFFFILNSPFLSLIQSVIDQFQYKRHDARGQYPILLKLYLNLKFWWLWLMVAVDGFTYAKQGTIRFSDNALLDANIFTVIDKYCRGIFRKSEEAAYRLPSE